MVSNEEYFISVSFFRDPNCKIPLEAFDRYPTPRSGRLLKRTILLKSLKAIALENGISAEEFPELKRKYFTFARLQGFIKLLYVPFILPQSDSLNSDLFSTSDENKTVGALICCQCVSLKPTDNEMIGLSRNRDFFRKVFERVMSRDELPRYVTIHRSPISDQRPPELTKPCITTFL
jgi:hypothetical protein